MFPGFLWKYAITKVSVTPGATNQSTGAWTPPTDSSGNISGIVQAISLKELQRIEPGLVNVGDRKITTEKTAGLKPGDMLQITEDASGNYTEWAVVAHKTSPNAKVAGLKQDFQTFLIKRKSKK